MPELPEVEIVRHGLMALVGAWISKVRVYRYDLREAIPRDLVARLSGSRLVDIGRRGKSLQFYLQADSTNTAETGHRHQNDDRANDRWVWLAHLGMSGSFHIQKRPSSVSASDGDLAEFRDVDWPPLQSHVHLEIHFADSSVTPTKSPRQTTRRLLYRDIRRFGRMSLVRESRLDQHLWFRTLGPEPEAMTPSIFRDCLAKSRSSIKSRIMDQSILAGLGNIYALEALWYANLHPLLLACDLLPDQADSLLAAIQTVLQEGLAAGGASIKDFITTEGQSGSFQDAFRVYGRHGKACLRPGCGGTIMRFRQSGRSSFSCDHCQALVR